jgi:protein-disulfide isomerase
VKRRRFIEAGAAGIVAPLLSFGSAGCKKKLDLDEDPTYAGTLVTMEDVDDSLASRVDGDRVRVPYEADAAIKGAAEPLVTIVEFSDFACPFCGAFAQTLDELIVAYPQDVRLVFMQFPLPMHPSAKGAALAALAAHAQSHFWAMHDLMFTHRSKLAPDDLHGYAEDIGLDADTFAADLEAPETTRRLELEMGLAGRLGVRGTPSFFVNGRSKSGAMDPAALRDLIEEERGQAQRLIDAGAPRRAVYAHISRAARPTGTNPGPRTAEPKAAESG